MKQDTPSPEILSKVRKLLALGTSPSEAEAASALEKARVLLARYGLALTDLEEDTPEVTEGILLEKKRLRAWESHLVFVVATATFTQPLAIKNDQGSRLILVGRELNIQAAGDLFAYLHRVVLILGRAHSQQVAHLDSFKFGLVHRIGERLLEAGRGREEKGGPWTGPPPQNDEGQDSSTRRSETALVVRMSEETERENNDFIQEKYGKTKTRRTGRRVEPESYHRGRAAGEDVSLNRQIR